MNIKLSNSGLPSRGAQRHGNQGSSSPTTKPATASATRKRSNSNRSPTCWASGCGKRAKGN